MRILFAAFIVTAMILSLAACNTFNGFGRDMSAAGHAISNAAN